MKLHFMRFFQIFSLIALVAVVLPPMPVAAALVHSVPYGTPVDVRLVDGMTSRDLQVGNELPIRVVHNVVVDGCIVIARGAHGMAEIIAGNSARVGGYNGSIYIKPLWVRAVDHYRIGLLGSEESAGEDRAVTVDGRAVTDLGSAAYAAGAWRVGEVVSTSGLVLLGIASFQKGGEASIPSSLIFHAKIANFWGVEIQSDILATDPDDTPIK